YSFLLPCPATSRIYTLSLHDALPISRSGGEHAQRQQGQVGQRRVGQKIDEAIVRQHQHAAVHRAGHGQRQQRRGVTGQLGGKGRDRKSTRLNSSHVKISYAVFCLKKK